MGETKIPSRASSEAGKAPALMAIFELERRAYLRRNVAAIQTYTGVWGFGAGFVGWTVIVPVFMDRLGLSKVLIGLLPALIALGYGLPQLFSAYFGEGLERKKKRILWLHMPVLAMVFALGVGSFFCRVGEPWLSSILILGSVGIYFFSMGILDPLWFDLVAKLFPEKGRGKFCGANWALLCGMMALGAFVARWPLDRLRFPGNFGTCFLIGAVFCSLGVVSYLVGVKEPASPEREERQRVGEFIRGLFQEVWSNRNYRNFLLKRIVAPFGYMAVSFLSVYAVEKFKLPSSAAASYMIAMMAGTVATGFFWGALGEKKGYRVINMAAMLIFLVAVGWALFAPSAVWFGLAFFMAGMGQAVDAIGNINVIYESCPRLDKTGYVALTGLVIAVPGTIAPVLGGYLAERFSFGATFGVALGAFAVCWVILASFFQDPRKLRKEGIPL